MFFPRTSRKKEFEDARAAALASAAALRAVPDPAGARRVPLDPDSDEFIEISRLVLGTMHPSHPYELHVRFRLSNGTKACLISG